MSLNDLMTSTLLSVVATAALFLILWMIRKRRYVPTPPSIPAIIPRWFVGGRNLVQRAMRTPRFRTAHGITKTGVYEVWNNKLALTRKVLEQIRNLARSGEPFSGLLISTHPVTMRMTQNGARPIVTRLIAVKDLDPSNFSGIDCSDLVATFHTHDSSLDALEHDERVFRMVDAFAGPKIHIIGSVKGLQLYSAHDGPAFTKRDKLEVR